MSILFSKLIFQWIYVVLLSISLCAAESSVCAQSVESLQDVIDLGSSHLFDTLEGKIVLTNKGHEPISIYSVKPACAECTEVDFEPFEILPGDIADVEFQILGDGTEQHYRKRVYIRTSDPELSSFSVLVEGHFVASVAPDKWVVRLGTVSPGIVHKIPLTFTSWSNSVRIHQAEGSSRSLWVKPLLIDGGSNNLPEQLSTLLKVLPPGTPGRFRLSLICGTNDSQQPVLKIIVIGESSWPEDSMTVESKETTEPSLSLTAKSNNSSDLRSGIDWAEIKLASDRIVTHLDQCTNSKLLTSRYSKRWNRLWRLAASLDNCDDSYWHKEWDDMVQQILSGPQTVDVDLHHDLCLSALGMAVFLFKEDQLSESDRAFDYAAHHATTAEIYFLVNHIRACIQESLQQDRRCDEFTHIDLNYSKVVHELTATQTHIPDCIDGTNIRDRRN